MSLTLNFFRTYTRNSQLFKLSRTVLCQSKSINLVRPSVCRNLERPCSVFTKSPEYSQVAQLDLTKFESQCTQTLETLTEYFDEIVENEAKLVNPDVAYSVSYMLALDAVRKFSHEILNNLFCFPWLRTAYWQWILAPHMELMWLTDKRRIDKFGLVHQPLGQSATTMSTENGFTNTMACHFTSNCKMSSNKFLRFESTSSSWQRRTSAAIIISIKQFFLPEFE